MTIGEKIKLRRLELNMSQEELAKKVGYKSRSSINKIELARDLPLKKVEEMAKVLGVTPAYLMGWTQEDMELETIEQYELSELMEIYSNMGYDIFHLAEIAYNLPPEGAKELYNFADYLANKYSIKYRNEEEVRQEFYESRFIP